MQPAASRTRRLLREVARRIALRDDPEVAFQTLRRRLPDLLPEIRFEVILQDPEDGTLSLPIVAHMGKVQEGPVLRMRPPEGELPRFLALDKPKVLPSGKLGDPARAAHLRKLGIRRMLVVPLVYGAERLGVICLGGAGAGPLPEEISSFARDLADLLSAVVGRAQMTRELQESRRRLEERAKRIRLVHQISTAVNASLLLDRIFRTVVKETRKLIDFDRASLSVVEREGERLRLLGVRAEGEFRMERAERLRTEQGSISGLVMATRKPYIVSDLSQRRQRTPIEERLYRFGLLSYVALPLIVRRKVVGSFNLGSRRAGSFSEVHVDILQSVAEHLAGAIENARLFQNAQDRMREMTALYEVAKTLLSVVDLDELLREVLRIVHEKFRFENCAVLLPTEGGDELYIRAARGYREETIRTFRVRIGEEGITGRVAHRGKAIYVPDVRKDPNYLRGIERGRSELAIPLAVSGEVIGVLDIESPEVDAFSKLDMNALKLFASQVALALDRARLFRKVQEQAMTDGLTGLLNQRYFHHQLGREVHRSRRTGHPFSLILVDMDNLKEINDNCGHLVGNMAISQVAEVLRRQCRDIDSAARYGGDEFAVILPETDIHQAMAVADRLRRRIAEVQVEGAGPVTVSCGVAAFPTSTDNETMLVVLADRAMYEAKRLGKNRSSSASTGTSI